MLGYCRLFLNSRCLSVLAFSIIFGCIFSGIANAEQYRISGFAIDENGFGISGGENHWLPDKTIAGETGFYAAAVLKGMAGKITPIQEGLIFSPGQRNLQGIGTLQSLINLQITKTAVVVFFRYLNLLSVPTGIAPRADMNEWRLQVDAFTDIESAPRYESLSKRHVIENQLFRIAGAGLFLKGECNG